MNNNKYLIIINMRLSELTTVWAEKLKRTNIKILRRNKRQLLHRSDKPWTDRNDKSDADWSENNSHKSILLPACVTNLNTKLKCYIRIIIDFVNTIYQNTVYYTKQAVMVKLIALKYWVMTWKINFGKIWGWSWCLNSRKIGNEGINCKNSKWVNHNTCKLNDFELKMSSNWLT